MKKNSFQKNTILLIIGTILDKGIRFVAIPLYSRWLSTGDYGLSDVFGSYASLIAPLVTLSIGDAVFRFAVDKERIDEKKIYITNGFIFEVVSLFVFLGFMGVAFKDWQYFAPFTMYALSEMLAVFLLGYLRAVRKISLYSFSVTISSIFTFVGVFVLVKTMSLGATGMLWASFFGRASNCLLIIIFTSFSDFLDVRCIKLKTIIGMVKYSSAIVLTNISWWIVNVSDRWIINSFLSNAANGIYAASAKIPNLLTSFTTSYFISWQEEAVDKINEKEKGMYYSYMFNKLLVLLLSVGMFCIANSFWIYGIFYDPRYNEAKLYTPILITASVVQGGVYYFTGLNIGLKKPKYNALSILSGAIINLAINICFIKIFKLFAAAISTLIAYAVIFGLLQYGLRDSFKLKIEKKTIICFVAYLYFAVMAYFEIPSVIIWINLVLSAICVIVFNKDFVSGTMNKLLSKLRHRDKATVKDV